MTRAPPPRVAGLLRPVPLLLFRSREGRLLPQNHEHPGPAQKSVVLVPQASPIPPTT